MHYEYDRQNMYQSIVQRQLTRQAQKTTTLKNPRVFSVTYYFQKYAKYCKVSCDAQMVFGGTMNGESINKR